MLASAIVLQGLDLAGNTSIDSAKALAWLNNFLQSEYRRKYPWQRRTVDLAFTGGNPVNAAQWDPTYLDVYQQKNGTVGRYATGNGAIAPTVKMDYRQYIVMPDRLTASGAPRAIVPDPIGAVWYAYPVPDTGYTVSVDFYSLPPLLTLTDTPLWSSFAPDDILVRAVKTAALDYQDDDNYSREQTLLDSNLAKYRRRVLQEEGTTFQSALDPRVFRPMPTQLGSTLEWP